MALRDLACYTLTLKPSADPTITELSAQEGSNEVSRYARVRDQVEGEVYSSSIYDALSGAKLASVGVGSEKAKSRRLALHNPDEEVSFEYTSKLGFEWTFIFEGNKYRWSREVYGKDYICSLDRKPDPRVEICFEEIKLRVGRARGSDSKGPGRLQILHYNIERFPNEIKDLRGLETLLVASLMCFVDIADNRSNPSSSRMAIPVLPPKTSNTLHAGPGSSSGPVPAPSPPTQVITAADFEDETDPNEILVGTNTDIGEHIARAVGLLEDPNMLFIVIRTKTAAASQKALEVSLGVTRFRHREGLGDLHQYVIEEDPTRGPKPTPTPQPQRGPKVINLDDRPPALPPTKPKWSGPPNIAIYLSSIELPDLKPKPKPKPTSTSPQPKSHSQSQSRPSNPPVRPPPPQASSAPNKVVRPPPPQSQQLPQHLHPHPNHNPGPPRMDGPGGSLNGGPRPPPPKEEDKEPRKSSFGRLFGR